ncbi:Protein ral2 [Zancudomyces culisetae]|uniref:Protein ral2 n=1 Tax=Zancudomyces culisetae TaxID=1213189 RepID=A0A1R1PJ17_ZANCU|nr:Protein ral2 [Zancudomyces culisetae]|eukprot:OMH80947.1 Protein ral2 [Zancudomyces culisetae]
MFTWEDHIQDVREGKDVRFKPKYTRDCLEIKSCKGDIPPPLTGSSLTYLEGKVYLIGGKVPGKNEISEDIYIYDVANNSWCKVSKKGQNLDDMLSRNRSVDFCVDKMENVVGAVYKPRFFHTTTAFRHYLIVCGGLGFEQTVSYVYSDEGEDELDLSEANSIFQPRIKQAGLNRVAIKENKTLKKRFYNELLAFDTEKMMWINPKEIECDPDNGTGVGALTFGNKRDSHIYPNLGLKSVARSKKSKTNDVLPSARYAHLASMLNDRQLLIIGGQGLSDEYIREYNVYDFNEKEWVFKGITDQEVFTYRSALVSSPGGGAFLFTNYNFEEIKHSLFSIDSKTGYKIKSIPLPVSKQRPPGLRFPSIHMRDKNTIMLSGTHINSEDKAMFSIWAYNIQANSWFEFLSESEWRDHSWSQTALSELNQSYLIFGNSKSSLSEDYKMRKNSYSDVMMLDMRSIGLARASSGRVDMFFGKICLPLTSRTIEPSVEADLVQEGIENSISAQELAQELGMLALSTQHFSDMVLETVDGKLISVNSSYLNLRCPTMCKRWNIDTSLARNSSMVRKFVQNTKNKSSIGLTTHSLSVLNLTRTNAQGTSTPQARYVKDMIYLQVPENSDVVKTLTEFTYTGSLDISSLYSPTLIPASEPNDDTVNLKRAVAALSRLLFLGKEFDFPELTAAVSLALYKLVNLSSALLILDAIHLSKLPEVEIYCLTVLKECGDYSYWRNSSIWNSISESTRRFVENRIVEPLFDKLKSNVKTK